MSDVPAEALILAALALALWGWRRMLSGRLGPWSWLAAVGAGGCAGLAVLTKFNGMLALFIIAAWALLATALPRRPIARKVAVALAAVLAAAVAASTFVALNPYLTARPVGPLPEEIAELARRTVGQRAAWLVHYRLMAARNQQAHYDTYALRTAPEKLAAVAVQGFGRFGLFGPYRSDSTQRFDWSQDWGGLIWFPWVAAGACWAAARGRRQLAAGAAPTAWAILVEAAVALAVVTVYLPLAWDRYYLSLQPGSALLAAGMAVAAGDWCARRARGERD
jgi:hypothetical protein